MDPRITKNKIKEERFRKIMEIKLFRVKYFCLQIPKVYRVTRKNQNSHLHRIIKSRISKSKRKF